MPTPTLSTVAQTPGSSVLVESAGAVTSRMTALSRGHSRHLPGTFPSGTRQTANDCVADSHRCNDCSEAVRSHLKTTWIPYERTVPVNVRTIASPAFFLFVTLHTLTSACARKPASFYTLILPASIESSLLDSLSVV